MKKVLAIIFTLLSLIFISPKIYAEELEDTAYDWNELDDNEKYWAYYEAVSNSENENGNPTNIVSYDDYSDKSKSYWSAVNQFGNKYITYGQQVVNNGTKWAFKIANKFIDQATGFVVNEVSSFAENNGLANYGNGNYQGYANTTSNTQKDYFYNGGASCGDGGSFDLGNGYRLECHGKQGWSAYPNGYYVYYDLYFNGELISSDNTIAAQPSFYGAVEYKGNMLFWIMYDNGVYRLYGKFDWKYTPYAAINTCQGSVDITNLVTYVPSGMTAADIKPSVSDGNSGSIQNPFVPVDGNDQSAVNEVIQEQNNEIISWLEKIYNAELMINSTISQLLNPLQSLYNVCNNLYSVCGDILSKLDNLTVKLKDWQGNEFKIDLGDLELGDIAVDFDVVYNITGITKITTPNDVFKDMNTHKSAIESKLGISNLKQTVNNFSTSIFGQVVFNPNGNVVNSTISETSSTPHLYFTFMGTQYDLFSSLSSVDSNIISTWKDIVTFFLYASTALCVIRSLPVLIGGVAGIENRASIVEHVQMEDNFVNTYLKMSGGQFPVTGQMYDAGYKGRWI